MDRMTSSEYHLEEFDPLIECKGCSKLYGGSVRHLPPDCSKVSESKHMTDAEILERLSKMIK